MAMTRIPVEFGAGARRSSFGLTHPGHVRERNEDSLDFDDRRGIWVVADGMGGYMAGDVASALVVDYLRVVRTGWTSPQALASDIVSRLENANARLRELAVERGSAAIGATVVCLAAHGAHALAIWCGDSRIYRRRIDGRLERITRDHSVVEDLVERGLIRPEDAESHPHAHVLTRAIGSADVLDLEFRALDLRAGDRFLLCSDGLTREAPESTIAAILASAADPTQACERLVAATLEGPAPDNVTALVVDFQ